MLYDKFGRPKHYPNEGQTLSENLMMLAAGLASHGANPLPGAKYKSKLLENTVLEGLERAAGV
jgi:hypothetical protein